MNFKKSQFWNPYTYTVLNSDPEPEPKVLEYKLDVEKNHENSNDFVNVLSNDDGVINVFEDGPEENILENKLNKIKNKNKKKNKLKK